MCFKRGRTERHTEARKRLAERPIERPSQTTRPRGNAPVDERDLKRGLERMEALVGR
jgi:hypothetical protein